MSAVIRNFTQSPAAVTRGIREIFFESSSRKEFATPQEKDNFYWKYVGFYLHHYPTHAWVALGEKEEVLGYTVVDPVTALPEIFAIQPHLTEFCEFYANFPAHLHVNCHASTRGLGIGSKLVLKVSQQLSAEQCIGLHIMTAPGSVNCSFYQKLGFDFEVTRYFNAAAILMMGKSL
ncbi:MAG TPA: GNAT family N-acetyltransferase [Bacteriovoracaceae bacterium]|nr:GNAT family N-acetyltransferase [Bacteriovoracaceae bacterium]